MKYDKLILKTYGKSSTDKRTYLCRDEVL